MQKVGSRDRQVNAAGLKGSMYVHPIIIKKALKLTQKPLQGLKLQIFFTPFWFKMAQSGCAISTQDFLSSETKYAQVLIVSST